MKPNLLAQFSGDRPAPMFWGVEVCVNGVSVVHISTNFNHASKLVQRLRELHPDTPVKLTADVTLVQGMGGSNA